MVETIDAVSAKWQRNPEPDKAALEPAGDVILDTADVTADAYLWEPKNCSEGWLQYNGDLQEVHE